MSISIKIFFVLFVCNTFLSCSNKKDMSKKKEDTSKEQPIHPQTGGENLPVYQGSPLSLPADTINKVPAGQERTIPIGTPVSAEEMERLKKESNKPSKKKAKKNAPDNNNNP